MEIADIEAARLKVREFVAPVEQTPGPPYWATNTSRSQGQYMAIIQDDGNFVVYTGLPGSTGSPIWASGTYTGHGVGLSIASGNNQSILCQADAAKNYYASFPPLTVKVTDSVLNPLAGTQVTWTVAPVGNSMLEQVEVVNDAGVGICPADWANEDNVGFHWTSSAGANGIASLFVTATGAGDIARFPGTAHFASWNGTAPIDASSGDQVRHRLSRPGNRQINRVPQTSWSPSRDATPDPPEEQARRPWRPPRARRSCGPPRRS